jgi:hypothetical protein
VVISDITTGDHPERANGRQRARFRAAQPVRAVAIAHNLSLQSAREIDLTREYIPDIDLALASIPIALVASRIVMPIAAVLVRVRVSRIARTSAQRPRIVVAMARFWLPTVVVAVQGIMVVTARAIAINVERLVIAVARIVAPSRVVKHTDLRSAAAEKWAGTKWGQSGAVSGGRGLPPDHDSPNKNGPDCLVLSRVV